MLQRHVALRMLQGAATMSRTPTWLAARRLRRRLCLVAAARAACRRLGRRLRCALGHHSINGWDAQRLGCDKESCNNNRSH